MPSNINTWLNGARFGKSVIVGLIAIGVWLGTITATLGDKAEKIDVATQVATQTEVLKGIARSLESINGKLSSFDSAQRVLEKDVAVLKAEAEKEDG